MLTTTEIAVNITIWILAITGAYWGVKGVLRRRRKCLVKKDVIK